MSADPPIDLMTDRPHTARIYDYLLGGKDNYAADRAAADAIVSAFPATRITFRAQRAFMHRAVRHLAEQGIDQFLDIGTGIPTEPNLHQIVQDVHPGARIVYVDNDPIVLAHAAALMTGTAEGRLVSLRGDAREPAAIRDAAEVADTLDFARPVALTAIGLLHFLSDPQAEQLLRVLLERAVPGSAVIVSQATLDSDVDGTAAVAKANYAKAGIETYTRSRDELAQLLTGLHLDIDDPGVVFAHRWHPGESGFDATDSDVALYGAVARVPGP